MKRILPLLLCTMMLTFSTAAWASLDTFLSDLNVQARADLPGFKAGIAAQFEVPFAQVNSVFAQVGDPAAVFMIYQLGQMSSRPTPQVLQIYRTSKSKGWGAIAKELGIKPGSPQFHDLKNGNLRYTGQLGDEYGCKCGQEPGHNHNHSHSHGKDNKGKGPNR